MKKHNIVKVVLITILVFLILSWIIPAAYYSGQYIEQGRVQMGLFDLFSYPLTSLSYFGYIALYIVAVGGFYGVLYKIPAYRTFLDKIAKKCEGKEKIVLSIIVILLALGVSICGLQIAFALFIPFIISLILLMGYDKIVAALVTVGSMTVGLAGGTYAYSNLSVLTSSLSLSLDYEIGVRFIILLVGVILVIFNTLMYIKNSMDNVKIEKRTVKKVDEVRENANAIKVESTKSTSSKKKTSTAKTKSASSKSNSKSKTTKSTKSRKNDNKAALKDEDIIVVKENGLDDEMLVPTIVESKHKIWPFVTGFILLLIMMVFAFTTWGEGGFELTIFEDFATAIQEFELFGFPIFSKILGTFQSLGTWNITDMFLPMAVILVILVIIYKVKIDDVFDGFAEGVKKAITPAFIVILLYTILVLVTYHPFQLVIYKALLGLSKGFNIATSTLVAILASLFNSDPAYVYQSVLPYFVSVVTNTDNYSLVGIIFQSMYGLTMLVAPTSLVLMGILSYLNVSYKEWLKRIWKLLLEFFIILLIIFIILALI